MEKKRAANSKLKMFLKKNVYYIIMAVCLLAIAAMITVTVLTKNVDEPSNPAGPGDVVGPGDTDNPGTVEPPVVNPDPVIPDPIPVVFYCPVSKVDIVRDYVMDNPVWHDTLNHYAVHEGIDFKGNDGDNVMNVYTGVVTGVDYDVLSGYTVTVKHNDDLTTTYSSLNEPTVVIGQTLAKGEVLGTMGVTATNEYLDGAHVHFCLYVKGEIADPYQYLSIGDK